MEKQLRQQKSTYICNIQMCIPHIFIIKFRINSHHNICTMFHATLIHSRGRELQHSKIIIATSSKNKRNINLIQKFSIYVTSFTLAQHHDHWRVVRGLSSLITGVRNSHRLSELLDESPEVSSA